MTQLLNFVASFDCGEFVIRIESNDTGRLQVCAQLQELEDTEEFFGIAYCDTIKNALLAGENWVSQGLFVEYLGSWLRVVCLEGWYFGELITSDGDYKIKSYNTPDESWNWLYQVAESL